MSDSVRPHRWQLTRLHHPWDSPGKNTGVGCHFLLPCMKVKSKSEVSRFRLLATPWSAAYQAPPSMGSSRQEYWSGLPLPSPKSIYYMLLKVSKPVGRGLEKRPFRLAAAGNQGSSSALRAGQALVGQSLHLFETSVPSLGWRGC